MNTRILTSPEDLDRYDRWLKSSGLGNLWQSLERKAYLEALGKEVRIYVSEDDTHIHTSALDVTDRTTGGYCTWEIPRGPIGDGAKLLEKIIDDDTQRLAISELAISKSKTILPRDNAQALTAMMFASH